MYFTKLEVSADIWRCHPSKPSPERKQARLWRDGISRSLRWDVLLLVSETLTGLTASQQVIAGLVCRIVYRVLLHPLSKYPGPKLAAISNLPYIKWSVTGQLHSRIRELHERHGDVVRIRPNSLTFSDPQAWTDIYGHRKAGAPPFRKDPEFYIPSSNGSTNLINSSEADHARQKRLLTHAFSERSLRDQESLVMAYIDLFITRLGELANNSQDVDLLHWLNYLTFDIVGDLAFGEPFGCLKDSAYHPWVAILFQSIKTGALLRALTIYPTLAKIIRYFMPKSLLRKRADHYRLSKEMVTRRLDMDTTRPDFISYILKYNDERGMSRSEIEVNAALLIAAGSETTATTLSACVYYLQKNPECYKALTEEVRQAFSKDEEITFLAAGKLPYLNAIIEESLRMYPPAPAIGPRLVPEGGAVVNGEHIPGGVCFCPFPIENSSRLTRDMNGNGYRYLCPWHTIPPSAVHPTLPNRILSFQSAGSEITRIVDSATISEKRYSRSHMGRGRASVESMVCSLSKVPGTDND